MKQQTFWEWLVEQFLSHGHQPYEIDKIVRPNTWEVYEQNKFIAFIMRTKPNEHLQAIYRGNLIFFMIDGSQFHYTWKEEYDGDELYERQIRYIPSIKSLGDKLKTNGALLTSVECVGHNSSVPECFCELT